MSCNNVYVEFHSGISTLDAKQCFRISRVHSQLYRETCIEKLEAGVPSVSIVQVRFILWYLMISADAVASRSGMSIGILNHFLLIARSGKGSGNRWPDRDWCFREASIVVGYHGHSCVTWVTASLKRHARSALTLIMQEFHAADSPRACHFYELQLYYRSITAVAPEVWIMNL